MRISCIQLTAFVFPDTSFHEIVPICNNATIPISATKVESSSVLLDVTQSPKHDIKTKQSCYTKVGKNTSNNAPDHWFILPILLM